MRAATLLVLLVGGISLFGCTYPGALFNAKSADYMDGSVVVVGKFELDPPIDTEHEQSTDWQVIGDGGIINTFRMATSSEPEPLNPASAGWNDWRDHIKTEWGEVFMVRAPREKTYLRGGQMLLDTSGSGEVWFPGGLYYEVPQGAEAIYIGTLRYTRGDFYKIERMQVLNEYDEAQSIFSERFGARVKLHKAPLRPVKEDQ